MGAGLRGLPLLWLRQSVHLCLRLWLWLWLHWLHWLWFLGMVQRQQLVPLWRCRLATTPGHGILAQRLLAHSEKSKGYDAGHPQSQPTHGWLPWGRGSQWRHASPVQRGHRSDSPAMPGTICPECTYCHDEPEQVHYLACAMCGSRLDPKGPKKHRPQTAPTQPLPGALQLADVLGPRPSSAFLPPPRVRLGPAPFQPATDDRVAQVAPVSLVRDMLSKALAAEVLDDLERDRGDWRAGQWFVHGKGHKTPRTSAVFPLDDAPVHEAGSHDQRPVPASLHRAAKEVAASVAARRPRSTWTPTYALANCYDGGQDCVGWHSDHLTHMGPRPIIVGLSLGACRRFELRSRDGRAHVVLPTPHNSATIMWDDAQEMWEHAVPRVTSIVPHARTGDRRYSLTFRMERRDMPPLGKCRCGEQVTLRAERAPGGGVAYVTVCRPNGKATPPCAHHAPCAWAEAEAARLRSCSTAARCPGEG